VKHHPSVLKKIRKLLRLAKAGGHEGARAAERAKNLMDRHGIDELSVDERVRMQIPGVDGEVWRESVLAAVAQAAGVQLLRGQRDDKVIAAIQGERQDVEAAALAYRRVCMEMTRQCWIALREAYPEPPPSGHLAEKVWCRIFHIGAAASLGESVTEALAKARKDRKNPPPGQPSIDEVPPTPEELKELHEVKEDLVEKRNRLERERSERELTMLAEIIGFASAIMLQESAFHSGVARGRRIPLKDAKMLPRNGTLIFQDRNRTMLTEQGTVQGDAS
jgi:hypothetical protein